jgi:putative transposase
MFGFIGLCLGTLVRLLRARRSLLLENLALRQQLAVLKRRHPRPRLDLLNKFFWVAVRRFWSGWQQSLIVVTPETVVRWHRAGFRLYWKLISKVRRPVGRRQTSKKVQELIFRMVVENSTWGAPRIHGELLMLGFDVSERTISRWMKRAPRHPEPARRWLTLLRNHREAIAAMDFFTVPTITFRSLESPCQNGVAERWAGSCRRDLLDHIIAVDERHLKRRLSEYIRYYHEDRDIEDTPTVVDP